MKKLKGFRLFVYAMSGLGPNLMMTLVTGYLNDALLAPAGISPAKTFTGSILVSAALCSVLFFAAKVIDAFIDIPLAYLTDRLHCSFGRRRMGILLGWVPMVASFVLLWLPGLYQGTGEVGTTIISALLLVVFYSSYTLCLVSYYGSFSTVTEDQKSLMSLSHYKSFFDTVQYCVAYALFPSLLLGLLGGSESGAISSAMLKLSPLMVTMLIPVFMLREGAENGDTDTQIPLLKSISLSFASRSFRVWLLTLFMMHMGLMLFLTGIGTTIPDSLMGISGWKVTVMNSAAFAPVPLMLLLFNHIKKRHCVRTALQSAIIAFAVAMFSFAASWKGLWGNAWISFAVGVTASTIGSYAVGVFFSSSYFFPARIAAIEREEQHIDHSAMYFAVQGLVTQLAGAVGVNLIYMNLVSADITLFGHEGGQFLLVPAVAGVMMIAACICAGRMNKQGLSD